MSEQQQYSGYPDISDSSADAPENEPRRDFIVLSASAVAGIGAASFVWPLVDSLNPSASVRALATIEVDVSSIEEGQSIKAMWQGKPVFIRRRTKEEVQVARDESLDVLPDPETDQDRVKDDHEAFLVVVGICTHLGCIPVGQSGDYGGWFCPCHGSHYDTSGRIRKGPAPTNLAVPPYEFINDSVIKIG